jgi:hypothetical protein
MVREGARYPNGRRRLRLRAPLRVARGPRGHAQARSQHPRDPDQPTARPDKHSWTNPRSGSRVSQRPHPSDNKCAGCHRGGLDHPAVRPIIARVCAKTLSGEPAKGEVPDTAAPIHSTASRGQFATLGESSRHFNHPKTYNTHKPKIRATLALVVLVPPHPAPPVSCHG